MGWYSALKESSGTMKEVSDKTKCDTWLPILEEACFGAKQNQRFLVFTLSLSLYSAATTGMQAGMHAFLTAVPILASKK
eukprot:3888762-Amphidinium_carterae.1